MKTTSRRLFILTVTFSSINLFLSIIHIMLIPRLTRKLTSGGNNIPLGGGRVEMNNAGAEINNAGTEWT